MIGRRRCTEWRRAYRELWLQFWQLVAEHGEENIKVVKINPHCTEYDVREKRISDKQRAGNALVDRRAKEGAALHMVLQARVDLIDMADDLDGELSAWLGIAMQEGG